MAQIPVDKAHLISLILEGVLYGIFTSFFYEVVRSLTRKRSAWNWRLLLAVVLMYTISTTHFIVLFVAVIQGFVEQRDGGSLNYYSNLANPFLDAHAALVHTQAVIGDIFLIYRCYVVWDRTWYIIVLPLITLLGTAVGGYGNVAALSTVQPGVAINADSIAPWMTTFAVTTWCTNVMGTALITFKMLQMRKRFQQFNGNAAHVASASHSALVIVIESAGIYLLAMTAFLITYSVGSNGQYMLAEWLPSLIGITFTAIILRISMGVDSFGDGHSSESAASSRHITTIGGTSRRLGDDFEMRGSGRNRSIQPRAVHVDHVAKIESDLDSELKVGYGSDRGMV